MSDYSWKEMMAVVFSREIEDTDKVTSGAHTEIFFAATMLAQKTHAPNLKLQLGGSVTLCQVTDIEVSELPKTSTGYELIRYAESVHDHPDTFLFYGAPGGKDVRSPAATSAFTAAASCGPNSRSSSRSATILTSGKELTAEQLTRNPSDQARS